MLHYQDLYLQVIRRQLQEPRGSAASYAYGRLYDLLRRYGDQRYGDVWIRRLSAYKLAGVRQRALTSASSEEQVELSAQEEVYCWFQNQVYPGLLERPQIRLHQPC